MAYQLLVADNNGSSEYGPFNTLRDATDERTSIIQAYSYNKGKGFTRENYPDDRMTVFKHAVYSTVVFTIVTSD